MNAGVVMTDLTKTVSHRVLAALVKSDARMCCREICDLTGLSDKVFAQRVGPLLERAQISRNKLKKDVTGRWHYFLTPKQRTAAIKKYSLAGDVPNAVGVDPDSDALIMLTDTADITSRLSFLRNLKGNTIFANHVMLNAIIGDYERTLNLRNLLEDARDQQERRAA